MSFRRNIKYYLVHNFGFTNKEAYNAILNGKISVNGKIISENIESDEMCEIYYCDKLLQLKRKFTYFALYKPRGIETTHNLLIENNLKTVFDFKEHLGFAGRLDKDSEGLLLLTNDGKFIQKLSSPLFEKEKEYIVTVNKPVTQDFIDKMEKGVDINIAITKPCRVYKISEFEFKIILTEGKNRQIRRMCKALGYLVTQLIRVRIDDISLNDLKPGEFREFKPNYAVEDEK